MHNQPHIIISFQADMKKGADIILKRARSLHIVFSRNTVQLHVDGIMIRQWQDNSGSAMIGFDGN